MAQSNYNIPNQSAPAVRAQLNEVFQSIATNNSGASAPSTTFPHQWWYDTANNILRQRNAADSAWIDIGTFDQGSGTFVPAGIVELSQGQVEDDTSTVFGTVSGQRLAQAVAANPPTLTTSAVLDATSGASVGEVGTYIIAWNTSTTVLASSGTIAGSNLRYLTNNGSPFVPRQSTSTSFPTTGTSTLTGTWRAITHGGGRITISGFAPEPDQYIWNPSLWLRIS